MDTVSFRDFMLRDRVRIEQARPYAAVEHPAWCDGREASGSPHMASVGDVESGRLLLSVDVSQDGDEPATVILGVYDVRRSKRHVLAIEQADHLCEVLSSAVRLARSSSS
jgi:hypothetical protein